jgi:hypothetical protein
MPQKRIGLKPGGKTGIPVCLVLTIGRRFGMLWFHTALDFFGLAVSNNGNLTLNPLKK